MRGVQLGLIDTGSSTRSLPVLLSAVEMGLRTQTALVQGSVAAIISTRVRVPHIVTAATIRGRRLFCSELLIVQLLFEGGDYSRVASNRRNTVLQ